MEDRALKKRTASRKHIQMTALLHRLTHTSLLLITIYMVTWKSFAQKVQNFQYSCHQCEHDFTRSFTS